jgi:hypothetical protein
MSVRATAPDLPENEAPYLFVGIEQQYDWRDHTVDDHLTHFLFMTQHKIQAKHIADGFSHFLIHYVRQRYTTGTYHTVEQSLITRNPQHAKLDEIYEWSPTKQKLVHKVWDQDYTNMVSLEFVTTDALTERINRAMNLDARQAEDPDSMSDAASFQSDRSRAHAANVLRNYAAPDGPPRQVEILESPTVIERSDTSVSTYAGLSIAQMSALESVPELATKVSGMEQKLDQVLATLAALAGPKAAPASSTSTANLKSPPPSAPPADGMDISDVFDDDTTSRMSYASAVTAPRPPPTITTPPHRPPFSSSLQKAAYASLTPLETRNLAHPPPSTTGDPRSGAGQQR